MILDAAEFAIHRLQQARQLIEEDKQGLICFALYEVDRGDVHGVRTALVSHITHGLDERASLGRWLMDQPCGPQPENVRQMARLAWIDRTIYQLQLDRTLP